MIFNQKKHQKIEVILFLWMILSFQFVDNLYPQKINISDDSTYSKNEKIIIYKLDAPPILFHRGRINYK